jgi:hypothetical protein
VRGPRGLHAGLESGPSNLGPCAAVGVRCADRGGGGQGALSSVLTCCDITTSPDGELVPVERRLAEIHHRYGPGHLVSRSILRATPMILRAVEQVHYRAARTA